MLYAADATLLAAILDGPTSVEKFYVVEHAKWSMLHKWHDHVAWLEELLLSLCRGGDDDGIRHFSDLWK